ncbi:MAG: FliM/FliN family flagellar motor C-terminal domain-containing protein [Parvularculaceae bacterium]
MLVGFDNQLVIAAADIAVSGALAGAVDSTPTSIDRALATALARRIALVFAPGSNEIFRHPEQSGPVDPRLIEASPSWSLISITVEAGVCHPLAACIALPTERCSARAAERSAALLRARFGAIKVNAHCIAGGFEAPLARILNLAPGEVIAIDWRETGAAPLMIGNKEFATGSLGEHDDRRAIKIGGR